MGWILRFLPLLSPLSGSPPRTVTNTVPHLDSHPFQGRFPSSLRNFARFIPFHLSTYSNFPTYHHTVPHHQNASPWNDDCRTASTRNRWDCGPNPLVCAKRLVRATKTRVLASLRSSEQALACRSASYDMVQFWPLNRDPLQEIGTRPSTVLCQLSGSWRVKCLA